MHPELKEKLSSNLNLKIGEWLLMPFGFSKTEWVVLEINLDERVVRLGTRDWLVSSSKWFPIERIFKEEKHLGQGDKRWWRFLVIGLKDFILPFGSYR